MRKVQEFDLPQSWFDDLGFGDKLRIHDIILHFSTSKDDMTWLVKNRSKVMYEGLCWNPTAKCFQSNKSLFLKKSIMIETDLNYTKLPKMKKQISVYFSPKQYTLWCMKNAVM